MLSTSNTSGVAFQAGLVEGQHERLLLSLHDELWYYNITKYVTCQAYEESSGHVDDGFTSLEFTGMHCSMHFPTLYQRCHCYQPWP